MRIKPLCECPQHLETIARWWQDEWGHYNPTRSLDDRKQSLQLYLSEESQLPTVWLAVEDDQLLGTAALDIDDLPSVKHGFSPWLASVFVAPQFRQQGIGRMLVEHVINFAQQHRYPTLTLFTGDQMAWYERMGFKEIDKKQYAGYDITLMQIEYEAQS